MGAKPTSRSIHGFCLCALLFFVFGQIGEAKKKPPEHPINLNTANSGQLQEVPGIGPATAEKILKMRKSYGPFKSVDDLRAIKGIGPKRLEKMRKYLTIGKTPQSKSKATPQADMAAKPETKERPARQP